MKGSSEEAAPGMAPDDPRISEWIDGRLDPAAAADVQRAVRASPELSLLVEELRSLKAALAGHEPAAVPAGFVRDMMAALAAGDTTDPAVEAEWRRLEEERIAEERAEASEDAVEPPRPPVPRWEWLAMAGALAAGLLVALVVNMPRDTGREVAMSEDAPAPRRPHTAPADESEDAEALAEIPAVAAAPPAEQLADRAAARRAEGTAALDALLPGLPSPGEKEQADRKQAAAARTLAESRPPQRDGVAAGRLPSKVREEDTFKAAGPAAAGRGAGAGAGAGRENASPLIAEVDGARAVVVRIDGPRGREALGRLIDARGLRVADVERDATDRARRRNREAGDAAVERIDVAGPPQAVTALLSALADSRFELSADGIGPAQAPREGIGGGAGAPAREGFDAVADPDQSLERLVIFVVDEPLPADKATEAGP